MENINLDDYHVSIEYLDDFEDNNIDNWINNSEKPDKINKLLNKIRKTGGSFETKNYQVTSTDPVLCPFFFKNGDTNVINYAETRHIYFYPNINDIFEGKSNANISINDMDNSLNIANNNHVIISPKLEKVIKEIVPEKVVNESGESKTTAPVKVINGQKKSKRKLNQTEEMNGSVDPLVSVKEEFKSPKLKKRKLQENNVDLDTSFVKGEPVAMKEEAAVFDVLIEKEVVDIPKENEVVDVTGVDTTEKKKKKKKKKSKETSENVKVESNIVEVVSMIQEAKPAINGNISLKKEKKHKKKHRKHEEKYLQSAE